MTAADIDSTHTEHSWVESRLNAEARAVDLKQANRVSTASSQNIKQAYVHLLVSKSSQKSRHQKAAK